MMIGGLKNNAISVNLQKASLGTPKENFSQLLSSIKSQLFTGRNLLYNSQSNRSTNTVDENTYNVNLQFLKNLLKSNDQIWKVITGEVNGNFGEEMVAGKSNVKDKETLLKSDQQIPGLNGSASQLLDILQEIHNILEQKTPQTDAKEVGNLSEDKSNDKLKRNNLQKKEVESSIPVQLISQLLSQLNVAPPTLNDAKMNEFLMQLQTKNESSIQLKSKPNDALLHMLRNAPSVSGQDFGNNFSTKTDVNHSNVLLDNHSIDSMLASLIEQSSGQQISQGNESMFPIKTSSLKNLFLNQFKDEKVQNLEGIEVTNQQPISSIGNRNNQNSKYLENTFSQLVKEINNDSDKDTKASNIRSFSANLNNSGSIAFQQMSKQEQFVLMTKGPNKTVSVNNMVQQFESILSKSQFSKVGGTQKLLINLHPESLGSLRIELIQKDQTTIARILATTEAAKDALESHIHNLKDAFAAQNIPINKVEIGTQLLQTQQTRFTYNEQQQQQQRSYQESPQKDQENDKEDDSENNFILSLDKALLNKTV